MESEQSIYSERNRRTNKINVKVIQTCFYTGGGNKFWSTSNLLRELVNIMDFQ